MGLKKICWILSIKRVSRRSWSSGLLGAGVLVLLLTACGGSENGVIDHFEPPEPEPVEPIPPPAERGGRIESSTGDDHFETGRFGDVFLAPTARGSDIADVETTIDQILFSSEFVGSVERREPFMDAIFEPDLFETYPDLLPCFRHSASPAIVIELKEPQPALLQAIADTLRDHPVVLSVESVGLDLGYAQIPEEFATDAEGRELGYDEYLAETCDAFAVTVDLDPSVTTDERTALADEVLALAPVGGVLIDREFTHEGNEEFFRPDLSAYPEMERCEDAGGPSIVVIVPAGDRASAEGVVTAFADDPRVAGFSGLNVDNSLSPFSESSNEAELFLCERLYAWVDLEVNISDAEAGVVVARALSVPGVADIELHLFEPEPAEGCDELGADDDHEEGTAPPSDAMGLIGTGGSLTRLTPVPVAQSEVIDPCFIPDTSTLTVYRGDPDLASQRALADALCDLPGVVSISSADDLSYELDPYEDCQALYLEIRFATDVAPAQRDAVIAVLEESRRALNIDQFVEDEFEPGPAVPEVVVGDIDLYACDPEVASVLGLVATVRLTRIDEPAAIDLAETIRAMAGVVEVRGNAVRSPGDFGEVCGTDLVWFWLTREATDAQRDAVYDLLAARPDVVAVVVEESEDFHFDDDGNMASSRWAGVVKFATEETPADIEQLVAQLESMPGVAGAERIYHEDEFFQCDEAEGDVCEGDVEE